MIIYVDVNTLALTTEGHVPLTDMALVRGDKIPLRIVLTDGPGQPADARDVPVLAVKESLGDDALVLAATSLERVTDVLGTAYVGSLSVNTVQLATAMGDQDRIDLVGEVVLVAPDGAQRTSRLIRVTVRADLLAGDYAPPEDVLADWSELVAASLASQLPAALDGALQERGMHVAPVTGSSTLTTGEAETPTVMACYALTWGDELLAGHLTDHCRLRRVTMTYYTDTGLLDHHWLRIWRLESGKYVVAGVAPAVALPANNQPMTWDFAPGVPLRRGDKIMLELCAGPSADKLTTHSLGVHAVMTQAKDGRGIASAVSNPPTITQATMAPVMSITVDYDDGVMVGGVELATVTQVHGLGNDVRTASADAQAAATAATTARNQAQTAATNAGTSATSAASSATVAQQALDAIPQVDAAGNMTLAGGLTTAATINANGGINIPLTAGAATDTAAVNRMYAAGLAAVADTYNLQIYLDRTITTATNNATVTERIPGQLMRVFVAAGKSSSTNLGMDHSIIGRSGYSKFGGFTLPIRMSANNATVKITLGMGSGSMSVRPDRDVDDYTRVPTSADFFGEVLDVTITSTRDAEAGGYWVRVREIGFNFSDRKNFIKTTRALLPYDGNTGIPASISGLVYHQYRDGRWSVSDGISGALWLMVGGYSDYACVRIANVRGIHTYQSVGFNACHLDIYSTTNGTTVDIGAPRTMQRFMRGYNPAYYGFEAVEYDAIKSETTEDFVDPDTQA